MPQPDISRQLAKRFWNTVASLHAARESGKKFNDLYTLMGCMFFGMETPYDPVAALGMRLLMKRMVTKLAYNRHTDSTFQMEFLAEVRKFLGVYPVAFPRLSDIPDREIPESVLEELHHGSGAKPKLPHEPREWRRKIRLAKGA